MKDYKRMTVGEIVADNFNNAGIFDKYGIDFCCHGSALLPEASKTAGADMEKVIEEIEHLAPTTSENIDFKSWPLDLLVDYILKIHHRNIRTQGPEIEELLDKICRVHGEKHPSLYNVQALFHDSLSVPFNQSGIGVRAITMTAKTAPANAAAPITAAVFLLRFFFTALQISMATVTIECSQDNCSIIFERQQIPNFCIISILLDVKISLHTYISFTVSYGKSFGFNTKICRITESIIFIVLVVLYGIGCDSCGILGRNAFN